MLKKILSLLSAVVLISASLPTIHADAYESNTIISSGSTKTTIVKDDANFRIAESREDNTTTRAIFDKKKNLLTIQTLSKNGSPIKVFAVDLNQNQSVEQSEFKTLSLSSSSNSVTERTFMNYEYMVNFDTDKWTLWKPVGKSLTKQSSKNVNETTKNSKYLEGFKDAVDDIDYMEKKIVKYAGASVCSSIFAIVAEASVVGSPVGIAAAGTAIGLGAKAIDMMEDLSASCKDAEYYYGKAK